MRERIPCLGLIAGNRSLPLLFAREARECGVERLVAVAFENETNPDLAGLVDEIVWVKVGQLGKLIEAFRERGIRHCVMLGQIAPRNLFDLRPDLRALGLLLRLKQKNAHTLFGAIAAELGKEGIELIEATPWLKPIMPGRGFHLGPKLTQTQRADVGLGFRIAKEIARLEIGQIAIVKNGAILAVEGLEGTDRCLQRGGELAGKDGGAVAVKVAKEGHDMRFDIPCVGLETMQTCAKAGVAVLALEADKTLILDREAVAQCARERHVAMTVANDHI